MGGAYGGRLERRIIDGEHERRPAEHCIQVEHDVRATWPWVSRYLDILKRHQLGLLKMLALPLYILIYSLYGLALWGTLVPQHRAIQAAPKTILRARTVGVRPDPIVVDRLVSVDGKGVTLAREDANRTDSVRLDGGGVGFYYCEVMVGDPEYIVWIAAIRA
jgi:hypothetical protein